MSKHWLLFLTTLALAMLVCIAMLIFGSYYEHSGHFSFLIWNLFLATVPLVAAAGLSCSLHVRRWSSWPTIGWSLLWLLFLPNSFYMISDFIHLREIAAAYILYNAVMFTSFIYLGVLMGFCSLYLVHYELRRRINARWSVGFVAIILLACSYGIYLGRDLRWNSWDVLINPFGLLFDVSDRLLHPDAFPQMFIITFSFFALLASLYAVIWSAARALRYTKQ